MQIVETKALYEQDFDLWVADTVAKLIARDLEHLDWENLIEEVEDLAGRHRDEIESRLTVLLAHLLKRGYVNLPECFRGWEQTIVEQRQRLRRRLQKSPSLRNYLLEVIPDMYQDARELVQTEYPEAQLPQVYPFALDVGVLLRIMN